MTVPLTDDVMVLSEEVILSKIFLNVSMSLDGRIAQPHDDPGPIHEFFFSDETKRDGIFIREYYDAAAAVISGLANLGVDQRLEMQPPDVVRCFVVTHEVPTDVPDGPPQFTYVTDGIDTAVRQAEASRMTVDEPKPQRISTSAGARLPPNCEAPPTKRPDASS